MLLPFETTLGAIHEQNGLKDNSFATSASLESRSITVRFWSFYLVLDNQKRESD